MDNINKLLNRLFEGKAKNFIHKENFKQSEEDEQVVRRWMGSAEGKMAFDRIQRAYKLKKAGHEDQPELHILSSPYANGLALVFDESFTSKTFSLLFFAFGLRMLDLGYYRVSLDRTIREEGDMVETTEKQYFKASLPRIDVPLTDQRYGNVSIEKDLVNNTPHFLKILVTVYSDHQYQAALPFEQFVEEIFKV
ncbi:MAG TPA: hypothetical protein VKX33_10885 [Cyclobacteriaceae bacterium]|nr:hypothetical protein [Cyclobacteriaceae bacterium]